MCVLACMSCNSEGWNSKVALHIEGPLVLVYSWWSLNGYITVPEPLIMDPPRKRDNLSLQRTAPISPNVYLQYIFSFWKEDSLPTRDKMASPKVPKCPSYTRKYIPLYYCCVAIIIIYRYVEYGDQTSILREGYWASYNVPFYEKVYNMSGYPRMVHTAGPLASHDLAARAKIFRRDQGKVWLIIIVDPLYCVYHLDRLTWSVLSD